MKERLKNKGHLILAFVVLLVYLSPNIFFPDSAHILIHDNLDSNVVWYKNIAESPNLFKGNETVIERTMNGLNRGAYISEYKVIVLLYYVFPSQIAYHLNIILQHLVGFIGMFLLLKRYVYRDSSKASNYAMTLVALAFGLLPFWPSGGIGIAGIPVVFYALLNIFHKTHTWKDWIWLIIFPLYSELVLSGMFVVTVFTVYFIYKMIRNKTFSYLIFLSLFILTVIYIGANYRMFQLVLVDKFESGRELMEFSYGKKLNTKGVLGLSFLGAVRGQHHFHTMAFPFLIFFTSLSFLLIKSARKLIVVGFGVILFLEILDHIVSWDMLTPFVAKFEMLSQIRFRWKSLTPFIWYFLFAKLSYLWFKGTYGKYLVPLLGINVLFVMLSIGDGYRYNNEFAENAFYRTYFDRSNEENITFEEFYMEEQFEEVQKVLPINTKVACLGILPEIAQYNNYNTFGGYYALWTQEYEDLFETVLGEELEGELDHVFYLNSKALNKLVEKNKKGEVIKHLGLNFDVLKEEGVTHLLSSNEIMINEISHMYKVVIPNKQPIFVYIL